jgi:hypothetical protein
LHQRRHHEIGNEVGLVRIRRGQRLAQQDQIAELHAPADKCSRRWCLDPGGGRFKFSLAERCLRLSDIVSTRVEIKHSFRQCILSVFFTVQNSHFDFVRPFS